MIGSDQCSPLSLETMTDSWNGFSEGWPPDPLDREKMSTRVPSGWTAIWLPIVNRFAYGAKIARAGSQVRPPLVVRAK